nr:NADH dehydrogenase subunit 3 [Ipomoea batatas]
MLVRKSLLYLLRQLGWGGLFLPTLWYIFAPENMMAPAGGEGRGSSGDNQGRTTVPGSSSGDNQGWTSLLGGSSGDNQGRTTVPGSSSGDSSEASVNQPHPVPSNPSPSVPPAQDTHVGNPPAPLIPFLQEEGERGDLLRRLHRLVSNQLKHYCERDLPAWRHSPDNAFFHEVGALILKNDLEVETEEIPYIRELITRLEREPSLMREIYSPYKMKRYCSTYPEKLSAYECGFDPSGDARSRFDIRFYLVSILFIIPDPEVTFSFPWAVSLNKIDPFGSWSMMAFLLILTIGSLYE